MTLQTFIPAQREIEDENTPGTEAYHNKEEAKKDFIRLLRKTEMEPQVNGMKFFLKLSKIPPLEVSKIPLNGNSYSRIISLHYEQKFRKRKKIDDIVYVKDLCKCVDDILK